MTTAAMKKVFSNFAQKAAPYLHITDDEHYERALELIEELLEDAADSPGDPINAVIETLAHAVEGYENSKQELLDFETLSNSQPADLAMLRLLMDQYELGVGDLPEIGSKSMVSRVLSGERDLSKKHITALSQRFQVEPGLFF